MLSFFQTLKAAFLMPANLVGLTAAGASSAMTMEPLPALVALGVEGVYLGIASWAPGFKRHLASRGRAETRSEPEIETLIAELAPSQREHYQQLRELRDRILANYRKLPGGRVLEASSEARLNALLTAFVRLLSTLNHYRSFLSAADRTRVERELEGLREEISGERNERLKDLKQKRSDILGKRLERFGQAAESRELVSHQLAGIEDLLRLTHDQSITLRDPESVNRQLVALTAEVEASEETVRELEKFLEFAEETSVPGMRPGTRVR